MVFPGVERDAIQRRERLLTEQPSIYRTFKTEPLYHSWERCQAGVALCRSGQMVVTLGVGIDIIHIKTDNIGMARLKRVQVELPPEIINQLRDIANDWRKATDSERVGLGTVIAGLLGALMEKPDTLRTLRKVAEKHLLDEKTEQEPESEA